MLAPFAGAPTLQNESAGFEVPSAGSLTQPISPLAQSAAGPDQPLERPVGRAAFADAPTLFETAPIREGPTAGSPTLPMPRRAQSSKASIVPPQSSAGHAEQEGADVQPMSNAPQPVLDPWLTPDGQRSKRAEGIAERPLPRTTAPLAPPFADAIDHPAHGASLQVASKVLVRVKPGAVVDEEAKPPRSPEPLLPPLSREKTPATGAIRSMPVTLPSPPGQQDAEPTEVHVTIGRIEITAVHEAAPPQRAAKPRRPLMSLDDYLNQRQKGR
jgi:hypothetical protein